jgi:hypothetical protein
MKGLRALPALLALALASCKDLEVPDLNSPGLDELQTNPTRAGILTAATGLLIGARANWGSQNGPVAILGILGREGYNLDAADPRFVSSLLIGPLSGGEPAFGGNLWFLHYFNIRNANIVLNATNSIVEDPAAGLTAEEKEAVRGFAKTIQALDFLMVAVTRDANGAPIDVDRSPSAEPAPIATMDQVYTHIENLLDSADTHLSNAGSGFPFALSEGFANFSTPATFRQFNRALRARVAVYRDDFTTATTVLGASFVSTALPLSYGAYHTFGTGSGDALNATFDPDGRALHADTLFRAEAQLQPGGAIDQRALDKTVLRDPDGDGAVDTANVQGIKTYLLPNVSQSPTDPIPIIRNEELILLRAEANIGLNNLAAAKVDLDFIRVNSGGLDTLPDGMTQAEMLDELLYNKRYSLFWEGGHRWIDMRHYGRLGQLPLAVSTHRRFAKFPFPINECTPRDPQPAGCQEEVGF